MKNKRKRKGKVFGRDESKPKTKRNETKEKSFHTEYKRINFVEISSV